MRCIIIRNSIEPSRTGNCTRFDEALCESTGFINFSVKRNEKGLTGHNMQNIDDEDTLLAEGMLIQSDMESPNLLRDNVLYYIAGFIVNILLTKLECINCRSELLLDPDDKCGFHLPSYPVYARFTRAQQEGGLVYPSYAVLKILKATEVIFRRQVILSKTGIMTEKNVDLQIQYSVLEQLGPGVFSNSATHFYEHSLGFNSDHLTSLLKIVTMEYL